MRFDIITIFPNIFHSYLNESIIKRAREKGLIEINLHDLRDWAGDKHRTVDDKPFGGGRGMVMRVGPIYRAIEDIKRKERRWSRASSKVILFSPRGKRFKQRMAVSFSELRQIIMICGRYEGVDERVARHIADEVISMGSYVSMGGELPAMLLVEAVARLIPGVIGKTNELKERVTKEGGFIEYPQYTRPEVFETRRGQKWSVPKVLYSGNHKEIEIWRKKHSKIIR